MYYVVVMWPKSQDLMERDDFSRCILITDESRYGPAAYMVPMSIFAEMNKIKEIIAYDQQGRRAIIYEETGEIS